MLTDDQIYQNKIKYMQLVSKLGIDLTALTQYLESIDYFNKPVSNQFFRAYKGGLCQYALDLCFELGQLVNAYFPGKYSETDVIKVALFRDLYRAELYEAYTKDVKNENGNWEPTTLYKYRAMRPVYGDINFGSYMISKRFIDFTDEQIEAITQSNTNNTYAGDIHDIMRNYPLVTLTRMADLATMYLN